MNTLESGLSPAKRSSTSTLSRLHLLHVTASDTDELPAAGNGKRCNPQPRAPCLLLAGTYSSSYALPHVFLLVKLACRMLRNQQSAQPS